MSDATPKIFQTGGFRVHPQLAQTPATAGWESDFLHLIHTIPSAIPYLSLSINGKIDVEEDQSITDNAWKSDSRMLGQKCDGSLSTNFRYTDIPLLYWALGYCFTPYNVSCVELTVTIGNEPVVGETWEDTAGNIFVFQRSEVTKVNGSTQTKYIFTPNVPPAVMALGAVTTTGKSATCTVTLGMMEIVMLPEYRGKEPSRAFTVWEEAAHTMTSNDLKTNLATIAKRFKKYDLYAQHAYCTSLKLSLQAAGLLKADYTFLAKKCLRRDTELAQQWQYPNLDLLHTQFVPAHYQATLDYQPYVAGVAWNDAVAERICLSSMELNIDQPTQQLQTYCSGLHIEEPIIEGKFNSTISGVIGRASVKDWQDFRDLRTPLSARFRVTGGKAGCEMMEVLVKKANVNEAGANEDNVAAEPFNLFPVWVDSTENPFATYCPDINPENINSPLLFRVRISAITDPMSF